MTTTHHQPEPEIELDLPPIDPLRAKVAALVVLHQPDLTTDAQTRGLVDALMDLIAGHDPGWCIVLDPLETPAGVIGPFPDSESAERAAAAIHLARDVGVMVLPMESPR